MNLRADAIGAARWMLVAITAGLLAATAAMIDQNPYTTALGTGYGSELLLVAGTGLLVAAVLTPGPRRSAALAAAACGVLLPEWAGWSGGATTVRSLARGAGGVTLVTAAGAAITLCLPHGRRRRWILTASAAVGAAAFLHGVFGLDPFDDAGCWRDCRTNPLAIGFIERPAGFVAAAGSAGVAAAVVASVLAALATRPQRTGWQAAVMNGAGAAVLVVAAALRIWSGSSGPDSVVLVVVLAAGTAGGVLIGTAAVVHRFRHVRARRALGRLIDDLSAAPPEGFVEAALAATLGDPDVRVVYWSPTRNAYVDGDGAPAEVAGAVATPIRRAGEPVAAVLHRAGVDPADVEMAFRPAVRLWLANAQLRAATLAELTDVRASEVRLAARSAAERRRIERDLHDGAQQRVVGLALLLRLARGRLGDQPDPAALAALERCGSLLDELLATLREISGSTTAVTPPPPAPAMPAPRPRGG